MRPGTQLNPALARPKRPRQTGVHILLHVGRAVHLAGVHPEPDPLPMAGSGVRLSGSRCRPDGPVDSGLCGPHQLTAGKPQPYRKEPPRSSPSRAADSRGRVAVAVLDCIIALLKAHKRLFAALRAGIKGTWRNVFSRIREVLYELPCAFGRLM